jgi:uncharacterized protein (DUF1330 family)
MTCYVIGHIEITDSHRYQDYAGAVMAQVGAIGAKVLAAGPATMVEGTSMPNQNVIIEFPDEDTVLRWYESEEYQAVRPIRLESTASSQIAMLRALPTR